MSTETLEWLNQNVLVGFTDKRGNAWHHKASEQGSEPNHYPGAIPVQDVERRLFHWQAVERPLYVMGPASIEEATTMLDDGTPAALVEIPGRKAVARDDTGAVLGIFKDGYQAHQPREWLLEEVAAILGDDLQVGSAGLLKAGAVAWVPVEVAENMHTPEGVTFRPNLLAATSFDGSLSTTYKRTATVVVCDNTMQAGLNEKGQQLKVKHSRYSHLRMNDARDALALVEQTGEQFAAEVARLTSWTVSTRAWSMLLDATCPVSEDAKTTRAASLAAKKRDDLDQMYHFDNRVAPWNGTAFGVLQAFNTWSHHVQTVRNVERAERNALNAITGATDKADADILAELGKVCASV